LRTRPRALTSSARRADQLRERAHAPRRLCTGISSSRSDRSSRAEDLPGQLCSPRAVRRTPDNQRRCRIRRYRSCTRQSTPSSAADRQRSSAPLRNPLVTCTRAARHPRSSSRSRSRARRRGHRVTRTRRDASSSHTGNPVSDHCSARPRTVRSVTPRRRHHPIGRRMPRNATQRDKRRRDGERMLHAPHRMARTQ
jgi:hypothetical protein